jgi:[ribosomal protein S5]-alanine N-acetyltransferase
MNTSDICTPRLVLKAITLAMMAAEQANPVHLAPLIEAQIASEWPPEYREPHVFEFMRRQYAEFPHTIGWHRYLILNTEPRLMIGTVDGHPRSPSEAEIGYAIVPAWQGKGLATEAVRAFIANLFADETLSLMTAQTFPRLTRSIRVLEKCNFVPNGPGQEEGALRFTLERARWNASRPGTG